MPALSEFIAGFGLREIFISAVIFACIVIVREHGRIFRRKRR